MAMAGKEIEIKILGIDIPAVEKKLIALGAKKIFDGPMTAIYYDFPDSSIRGNGGTLRLREEGARTFFTLKKDIESIEAKVREEHQIEVSDFNGMKRLLETIGLQSWISMKKHRTSYELREAHFEIDTYEDAFRYIPAFLEIEGSDIESVYAHAKLLGFSKNDCRPWDILQVAAFYSSEDGLR